MAHNNTGGELEPSKIPKQPLVLDHERYESLVRSIDGIVWEADAETFQFLFVNKRAEQILGYPVEQWLSEPDFWAEHIHPDDREWAVDLCLDAVRNGQDHSFEYRMIAADGRIVWMRDVVALSSGNDGRRRLRGVMVEITDRVETLNALVRSETRLKMLLGQLPAIVWSTNRDLEFTEIVGRGLSSLDMGNDEMIGLSLSGYFRDAEPTAIAVAAHKRALEGESFSYELAWLGRIFDCHVEPLRDASGAVAGCVGLALDITERKAADQAMRRNEELFRAIVEDQTEMIVRWKPDGTRTFVNEAYCRVFGGRPESFIGTSFFPLIKPEYRKAVKKRIGSLTPDAPVSTETHESISARGEVHWQEWTDRGIFDDGGRLVELQSTGRDITESKLAADALFESQKELVEAQRLANVGSWTWDVDTDAITWSKEIYRRRDVDPALTPPPLKQHQEFYTSESWERLWASLENAVRTGEPQEVELELVRPGGRQAWTVTRSEAIRDQSGRVVKLRGTTQDITESKLAAEKLRLSEERFAKAFNASPEPISIYRHEDGKLLEVNERWVSVYGYTREEAIELTAPARNQIYAKDRETLRSLLQQDGSVRELEIDLKTKSGEIRHVSISAEQIVINDELCNIFLHRDITDRKRAEQENAKLINDLGERVKELTALHETSAILQDESKSVPELLQAIVRILPRAWQYPEITAGRIRYGEVEFKTRNFARTRWSQSVDFTAAGISGLIEIVYLEKRQAGRVGPFLPEEKHLLSSLAKMISSTIDRRHSEEALRESQRRFSDTLINLDMIAVMTDADGIITFCNDYLLQLTGWRHDEAVGRDWFEMFVPEDQRQMVRPILEKIPKDGSVTPHFENEIMTRSGERRLVKWTNTTLLDTSGRVIGVAALGDDITEMKLIEQQLVKSEESYRDLVENALDIIYTHDLEGNYRSINRAGEKITGYTREEALDMNLAQTVAPDFLDRARQMLRSKIAGEPETVYDLDIIAKDGRRVSIEVSTRLMSTGGKPTGIQGIARDVTERRQLQEQLRQSQKLESIGQLAGGIAHDFNNILTAINGYSELILRKLGPDDPLRSLVEEIRKAGGRSSLLISQLLAFSRKQVLQPTVLDLNDVVLNIENMLRPLIGGKIDLKTVLAPSLDRVKADPVQMEQVVMNLVVNAKDAMPDGGRLTIETKNVYMETGFGEKHVGAKEGHYVLLEVSDTGSGMDEETRLHIFEPFFTTKEAGKGTGLGLSTVYGIVKQSAGYIWVESEPGAGTTFSVYLPKFSR